MYYLLAFLCGVIAGAIGAVIIYRRNIAKVEAALADAVILRDKARADAVILRDKAQAAEEALKKKVGG